MTFPKSCNRGEGGDPLLKPTDVGPRRCEPPIPGVGASHCQLSRYVPSIRLPYAKIRMSIKVNSTFPARFCKVWKSLSNTVDRYSLASFKRADKCAYFSNRLQWHRKEVESGGAHIRRIAPKFCLVLPLHFSAVELQSVVLVSAFVMVSTVWSVSCLLFSTHGTPVPSHL